MIGCVFLVSFDPMMHQTVPFEIKIEVGAGDVPIGYDSSQSAGNNGSHHDPLCRLTPDFTTSPQTQTMQLAGAVSLQL